MANTITPKFQSGGSDKPGTRIGQINRNWQICLGHRGKKGTDNGPYAFMMVCLVCGHQYGANGSNVYECKCINCQTKPPKERIKY